MLNLMLKRTGARPQLDPLAEGGWHVHFHGSTDALATGWAAGCATGLALAIGSDLAGRLGVCAAERCDRVYVDTSKNGDQAVLLDDVPEPHEDRSLPAAPRVTLDQAASAPRPQPRLGPSPSSPSVRAIARPIATVATSSTSSSRSGPSVKQCTVSARGVPGSSTPPSWRTPPTQPVLCAKGVSSTSGGPASHGATAARASPRATAWRGSVTIRSIDPAWSRGTTTLSPARDGSEGEESHESRADRRTFP